ncbi:hypothetical protein J7K93_09050 [bacterium]|nr:hypothetical protein [bacterium]
MIKRVLKNFTGITGGETLLIISSEQYKTIAVSFYNTSVKNQIPTTLIIIPDTTKSSFLPKKSLTLLIKNADVVFFFLEKPVLFSESSLFPHLESTRIISFCGVNEDQLNRICNHDISTIIKKSRKIADIFSIGKNATITTEDGTDLKVSISRFKGNAFSGKALSPGQYTTMPFGFCSINTMRGVSKGKIIANGSFTNVGLIKKPVAMHISNGRVNRMFGDNEAKKIRAQIRSNSKPLRDIISIGVGTNPYADFSGHPFEDKCAIGSLHITLGHHESSSSVFSRLHRFDIIIQKATLKIDSMILLKNGDLKV